MQLTKEQVKEEEGILQKRQEELGSHGYVWMVKNGEEAAHTGQQMGTMLAKLEG